MSKSLEASPYFLAPVREIGKRGNMELTQAEYYFLKDVLTNTVDWATLPSEHIKSLQSILVKLDNAILQTD
jgi:hypothetical protein